MNQAKRLAILDILADHYRDARIELHYKTPYQLLIAVLLSAQATDISVNKATKDLYQKVSGPEDMLLLGKAELIEHIKAIGLYNSKANNVMSLSEMLVDNHDGKVPREREALESLPGVGRKTANVVLNELYGEPTIAVDTHIFRVCNRTGFAKAKTPLGVEKKLIKYVPLQYKPNLHQWLIQLGRYTCISRRPKCQDCVIKSHCEYSKKELE